MRAAKSLRWSVGAGARLPGDEVEGEGAVCVGGGAETSGTAHAEERERIDPEHQRQDHDQDQRAAADPHAAAERHAAAEAAAHPAAVLDVLAASHVAPAHGASARIER
jgi:hypothetical protein